MPIQNIGPPPFIKQEAAFDRWMRLLYQRIYSAFVGDSGSGGSKGLVPAPAAGDAAAGKYLDADGTWSVPPAGSSGASNVINSPTTIAADTSYVVVAYLTVSSTLTVNGNLAVI